MRAAIVITFASCAACAATACAAQPQPVLRPGIATVTAAYVERGPRRRPPLPAPIGTEQRLYASPPETIAWWAPLDQWRARWPQSARVLDAWRVLYPLAAAHLEGWADRNPEKMRALVVWAVAHRYDTIGSMLLTRAGWGELAALGAAAPEAFDAFLHWARASGPAAIELVEHAGGLAYVESAARASNAP
jgi:hypothetical protein